MPRSALAKTFGSFAFTGICWGLLGVSIACSGSCLISSSSSEDYSGTWITASTFSTIEPGVTTQKWVEGTLGEPTTRTTLEDGSQLWKYSYAKTKNSSGAVLFVFGGSSRSTTGGACYVQLKDGIVTKAWRSGEN